MLILKINSNEKALQALQKDETPDKDQIDKAMASEMREIKRLAEGIQESVATTDMRVGPKWNWMGCLVI